MSDYLIQLGKNPAAKKLAGTIGVPMPQALDRPAGPRSGAPLKGKTVISSGAGDLGSVIRSGLTDAGATVEGEGHEGRVHGLVYDASNIKTPADLRGLYDFFHPRLRSMERCGRIVVLSRPWDGCPPEEAASLHGVEGFVRSVAKEVGRNGTTAQLILVDRDSGAADRVAPVLEFILSNRSAFISGQIFRVSARAGATAVPAGGEKQLEGKVALVTGAARGIGATTARTLAGEGARVICLDRPDDEKPLSDVALSIDGAVFLRDLTEDSAPGDISRFLLEECGGVDIVIHNAGITRDKTLVNMDESRWDMTIAVNLAAVIRLTNSLLADGCLKDNGRILCLSSIAGIAGNRGQTNYATSKSAIIGYVESLAGELAGRGITVNAVAPGFIETRMTAAIPFVTREVARRLSNVSQGGLPEDIAETLTFMATPGASGLTGNLIRICGGSLVGA